MTAPSGDDSKSVLFIANGNGEDSIAAAIIAALPAKMRANAYPMVGPGGAYADICPIVGPRSFMPSEGWRHTSGSMARDVKGGMLSSILPAYRFLKSVRGRYDKIVAVGDFVSPLMCALAGLKIDLYLDVFKSGYAHRYSFTERFLIKRVAKKVYCRDDMLASALRKAGIAALCKGNIMLDSVPSGQYDFANKREHPLAIILLPGSRVWTAESLKLQIAALQLLPENMLADIFVGVAGGIDVSELAEATGMQLHPATNDNPADLGFLQDDRLTLHLAQGVIGNLLSGSDIVLSQAGTATQQALGLGKPVITFNRFDNRPKRMADEQALMGEARILTMDNARDIADAIVYLGDKQIRQRLGAIGRERLGGPGTLAAVVADLVG